MRVTTENVGRPPILGRVVDERAELISALRWIANNVKPYGPAQAHAHNALRRCGIPVEFDQKQAGSEDR